MSFNSFHLTSDSFGHFCFESSEARVNIDYVIVGGKVGCSCGSPPVCFAVRAAWNSWSSCPCITWTHIYPLFTLGTDALLPLWIHAVTSHFFLSDRSKVKLSLYSVSRSQCMRDVFGALQCLSISRYTEIRQRQTFTCNFFPSAGLLSLLSIPSPSNGVLQYASSLSNSLFRSLRFTSAVEQNAHSPFMFPEVHRSRCFSFSSTMTVRYTL